MQFGRDHIQRAGDAGLKERLWIGAVMGQDGGLLPNLSLRDNIALPMRYHETAPEREIDERVDALFAYWDKPDSPGAAVAVLKDGEVVVADGYGSAQLEHEVPCWAFASDAKRSDRPLAGGSRAHLM